MMKNWKKCGVGALCAAMLLAGCGADNGGTTPPEETNGTKTEELSLDALHAANTPEALLEKHGVVTVRIQRTEQDGSESYTAKVQYTRDSEQRLLAASHYSYTADSSVGEDELYGQACFTAGGCGVYLSTMQSDDRLGMNCYPSGEYESYVLDALPACRETDDSAQETVDDRSEQDGAVLISTTTRYEEMTDYYYTTLYYIDPETNELLAMSVTDYSVDADGQIAALGATLYDWSYSESYAPERDLAAEALNSGDACELTLVYDPGAADEETQRFSSVKRGTYVMFVNSAGCRVYSDAELSREIDYYEGIDTSGESAAAYIVPLAEEGR